MRDRRQLIDFVGVGPPKTGTTWLHSCLFGHPELCLPEHKETYFFDRFYDRGADWYRRQFRCSPDLIRGEIGASYFGHLEALDRIHKHNEKCKVIVTLRDPVARTFSFYLHHRRKGRVRCDFVTAFNKVPWFSASSRYEILLPRWVERFGRERVLIILLQDVAARPLEELQRVHDFLEIGEWTNPELIGQRIYAASMPKYPQIARIASQLSAEMRRRQLYWVIDFAKRIGMRGRIYTGGSMDVSLDPETRASLIERFLPTIEYVEDFLDRPLPEWRTAEIEPARSESPAT